MQGTFPALTVINEVALFSAMVSWSIILNSLEILGWFWIEHICFWSIKWSGFLIGFGFLKFLPSCFFEFFFFLVVGACRGEIGERRFYFIYLFNYFWVADVFLALTIWFSSSELQSKSSEKCSFIIYRLSCSPICRLY